MFEEINIYNKYKIENIIGKGKFGVVYKGSHLKTNKEIAIKKENNDSVVKILKHETTILNYLYTHGCKCIPIVFWFGLYNNSTYLVMTYYPCSLYDYRKKNKLEENEIHNIMIQMINILEHIHKHFVIHRDIKPHNFMMDENNDLFLIDFGISTIYIDDNNNHIQIEDSKEYIVGTPNYISYNIHNGIIPSRRDDLISIGYIFLFLLLGSLPWEKKMNEIKKSEILPVNHVLHSKNIFLKNQKIINNMDYSPCFTKYIQYCYNLEFDTDPKYYLLRHIVE